MNTPFVIEPSAFKLLAPLLVVVALSMVVLLWDVLLKPRDKGVLLWISLTGLGLSAALSAMQWRFLETRSLTILSGHFSVDRFGIFFNLLFLGMTAMVILFSRDYLEREEIHVGEYYALLLFALSGMMMLATAADLITLFVGVELMSIPVYVLVAFNRSHYASIEGALKYFILGAVASAILLYGMAFTYGMTGSTQLGAIRAAIANPGEGTVLLPLGVGLLFIGFAFKVAAAPFHMWAPDAYEGAATPVTAAMATGVKVAAFAAFIRVFFALLPAVMYWEELVKVVAVLSMVVGNVAALRQNNLKRMLAYSGVAHSGYLMLGLLGLGAGGSLAVASVGSMAYYLLAYTFTNLGAFAVIIAISRREDEATDVEGWTGLGFRYPLLGAAMTLFMLSLGGMPPTAGFMGKLSLFSNVVQAGQLPVVIVAVLMSAVSFYYYLRVVVRMYMHKEESRWSLERSWLSVGALSVAVIATLWLGIFPSEPVPVLEWARATFAALV